MYDIKKFSEYTGPDISYKIHSNIVPMYNVFPSYLSTLRDYYSLVHCGFYYLLSTIKSLFPLLDLLISNCDKVT